MTVRSREGIVSVRRLTQSLVLSAVAAFPLNVALAQASPGRAAVSPPRILLTASLEKPMSAALPELPQPAPALPDAGAAQPPVDNSIEGIVRAAAMRAGADPDRLLRVASCESGLNPGAYNARSGASGLFQFLPSVFRAHGGADIWSPREQADIAAAMFAAGWAYQWSCQ